tara:strand:- start:841 stop:1278 length:438 start_codon:yes stop_codon:yes gene_type:complete
MTKECVMPYELNALVDECEQINVDEISQIYAIKTFRNGKLKFEHKDSKSTYFYARRVLNSYNNGYKLEIDFHYLEPFMTKKEKQRRNINEVMKDIEDVKVNLWKGDLKFEKNITPFYNTNLYQFIDHAMNMIVVTDPVLKRLTGV